MNKIGMLAVLITLLGTVGAVSATSVTATVTTSQPGFYQIGTVLTGPTLVRQ